MRSAQRVVVVGGLSRLARHYRDSATEHLRTVDVENTDSHRLEDRVRTADGVVLVVPNISHNAAEKVRECSRRFGVVCENASSPGVAQVRRSIERVVERLSSTPPHHSRKR
jgi:cellobiose-specific phosphotransferase system component IIB